MLIEFGRKDTAFFANTLVFLLLFLMCTRNNTLMLKKNIKITAFVGCENIYE